DAEGAESAHEYGNHPPALAEQVRQVHERPPHKLSWKEDSPIGASAVPPDGRGGNRDPSADLSMSYVIVRTSGQGGGVGGRSRGWGGNRRSGVFYAGAFFRWRSRPRNATLAPIPCPTGGSLMRLSACTLLLLLPTLALAADEVPAPTGETIVPKGAKLE